MKFKEFYTQKKNISPRLEKILKENIAKAIECSYKNVLNEGRWAPKSGGSSHTTIDSWSDVIDLDDEEIKDALTSTLGGREEVVDKALEKEEDAIDKIEKLLFQAKKEGNKDKIHTFRVALKSILAIADSEKAEEIATKHKKELEDVKIEPVEAKKDEAKEEGSSTKAAELATSAAESTKELDKTEEKKAETPEEKQTEKTLAELLGQWNTEVSGIEKNRNIGEALVQLDGINDSLDEARKKFEGMLPRQMIALYKRIENVSLKLKKRSEGGKGKEDPLSDKPKEEKVESVKNSSDKELLEESVWDLFTNFFGSNAGQKAIAAEELIDQHGAEMSDMLMNFYIKNPKTLLVVFEALGSITDSKLKQQMAQYMYYMFLMHQGKEKKWFKKDATDLLNKYSSDKDIDAGIKKAQTILKTAKIIP